MNVEPLFLVQPSWRVKHSLRKIFVYVINLIMPEYENDTFVELFLSLKCYMIIVKVKIQSNDAKVLMCRVTFQGLEK